jgi:hypothetical protein
MSTLPVFTPRHLAYAAVLALSTTLAPVPAWSQVSLSIRIAPPPLPIYVQPEVPGDGYLWTPGYWGWSEVDNDYYWVPGTWVRPPRAGHLWTPGYWGFVVGGGYRWNVGYWGPRVGFYGGLNYGFGYGGVGFQGGRWERGVFRYNRSVTNVNITKVRNVYNTTVVNNNVKVVNRSSVNGGPDGTTARASATELRAAKAKHEAPTADQVTHEKTAAAAPEQREKNSHGEPPVAATPKPSEFKAPEATRAAPQPAAGQPRAQAASQGDRPAKAQADRPAKAQPTTEQADKPGRIDKAEQPSPADPSVQPPKAERPPKADRPVKPDKVDRPVKPENLDRPPKAERPVKPDKADRAGRLPADDAQPASDPMRR